LPPTAGENFWSHVATATYDVEFAQLKANISISLCSDGLYILDKHPPLSQATKNKIKAIMSIAAAKDLSVNLAGKIKRQIHIEKKN
jgi:hypothetical protein